jgi:hypothetical protein
MTEIIFSHYNFKKDDLNMKRERMIISPLRHHILVKKADNQFIICTQAMEDLMRTRREFFKDEFIKFEKTICDMDRIGANITENPFNTIFNSNKKRR